jgi:hypothetical protein
MSAERDARIPAIARRVGEHRRRCGMTTVQLATRVGRSPMWVDRLENGDLAWIAGLERGVVEPSEIPVLTDLASVLGIGLAELVGPGVVMFPPSPPRPAVRPAAPPRPRAPTVAVALAVGVATAAGGLGVALTHAALIAAHPKDQRARASASAGLVPAPPAAPAPSPETAVAVAEDPPAWSSAPRAAPTPDLTPAPPLPAPRVVVATTAPHPPAGVRVFPSQLTASVGAGNGASNPVLTFTVTNRGDVAESLGAISLTNRAAHVVRDDCGHAALPPGGACHVSVRIGPAPPGRYTGPLVIAVDGVRATAVPVEIDVR